MLSIRFQGSSTLNRLGTYDVKHCYLPRRVQFCNRYIAAACSKQRHLNLIYPPSTADDEATLQDLCIVVQYIFARHTHYLPVEHVIKWQLLPKGKIIKYVQWLWFSWQSGCFLHQRSTVRIQSSQTLYYQLYCKDENKEKEAGNGPIFKKVRQNCVRFLFSQPWSNLFNFQFFVQFNNSSFVQF